MADLQDVYAARIRAIYERAEMLILAEIRTRAAQALATEGWTLGKAAEIASLRAWLKGQIPEMLADVPADVREAVQAGYNAGGKEAGQQLIAADLTNPAPQAYQRGASVRAIAKAAVGDLTATHARILRSSLDAYRDVIAGVSEDVVTGVASRVTSTQAALNHFANRGIAGFIDKAGRAWDLASYSEMATRSAVIRSSVAGKAEKYRSAGQDLVIVSDHWEECELCAVWEGKVLSLTGKTPGYSTLADAEAEGLFHPNCRHTTNLYRPGITKPLMRQSPKDTTEQKRVYGERMTQRRLERGVRQWKRREMAALNPIEQAKAGRKVVAWKKGLDDHIDAVNKRRGGLDIPAMKKQPQREKVIFAPDAVRTERQAAAARRKVLKG